MMDTLQLFQSAEHQPFTLSGGKPAVLLIHGYPGTPAEMRPLAEALHQATGWTARGMLLPGFGPQIETLAERTKAEWIAAVKRELRDLQRDHAPVIIAGLSMGGALAIVAAAQADTAPAALILFAPFWKVDHLAWTALPAIKYVFPNPRIFRLFKLDFENPETRAGIHQFMPDADLDNPHTRQEILDFRLPVKMFDQIHQLGQQAHRLSPRLNLPTLVIQGRQDTLVKPARTRQMIARFGHPATYQEINAEHGLLDPTLADWPQLVRHVTGFLTDFQTPTPERSPYATRPV